MRRLPQIAAPKRLQPLLLARPHQLADAVPRGAELADLVVAIDLLDAAQLLSHRAGRLLRRSGLDDQLEEAALPFGSPAVGPLDLAHHRLE